MRDIYEILAELGIKYVKHEHPAVFTCEEAHKVSANVEGGRNKNLLLRNKNGDNYYLFSVSADKRVDMKWLREYLGESKLSFASPERLMRVLGLTPGSVTPFGLICDGSKEVTYLIDKDLLDYDKVNFHPNINTATLELDREDFLQFIESRGNEFRILAL